MVSSYNSVTDSVTHSCVNACLTPLCDVHNKAVVTVEGLRKGENLHPIQERFTKAHASQCGFCTPGFIMAFYTLLRNKPNLSNQDILDGMDGNLCRCTGYRPILSVMKSFSSEGCCGSGGCADCPGKTVSTSEETESTIVSKSSCCMGLDLSNLDQFRPDADFIFPPALKAANQGLHIKGENEWFAPTSVNDFLAFLKANPGATILGGNGSGQLYKSGSILSIKSVAEFKAVKCTETSLEFGSAVTFQELINFLDADPKAQAFQYTKGFRDHLAGVANQQVRNQCTVGGNLVHSEWNSDVVPSLSALNAKAIVINTEGVTREADPLSLQLQAGEALHSVHVPAPAKNACSLFYAIGRKPTTSRSMVSAGLTVVLGEGNVVQEALFAFSGIDEGGRRATHAIKAVTGQKWSPELLDSVLEALDKDFAASVKQHTDSTYRLLLVKSFFLQFIHSSCAHFGIVEADPFAKGAYPVASSKQQFYFDTDALARVHTPTEHQSGSLHTTGQAVFTDDIPTPEGCLFAAVIFARVAHAKIDKIDDEAARALPGVRGIFYASDLKYNVGQGIFGDESVFASSEISYHGDIIGVVAAETHEQAQAAAKAVVVHTTPLPVISSIEDALAADSVYDFKSSPIPVPAEPALTKGDLEKGFAEADVIIEDSYSLSGAEHWYMEPHCHLAVPGESGTLTIYATAQGAHGVNTGISRALGIPLAKINCVIKRLGGGFGGKGESKLSTPTALCAVKLGLPVKMLSEREIDLVVSGKRGAYQTKYKVGAKKDGTLVAMDFTVYNNGGCTCGFSRILTFETMQSLDNAYNCPNFSVLGVTLKTNRVSSKALRGAGTPQALAIMETAMEHLAYELGMSPAELREKNLYKSGDHTPFHQKIKEVEGKECIQVWNQLLQSSDYAARLKSVEAFNAANKYKKRGLAIVPTRYLLIPPLLAALFKTKVMVGLHEDGSCILLHGGIEMGQGMHTKLAQITAQALEIPLENVTTAPISSTNTPNSPGTGGSTGTDVWGPAIIDACTQLITRLTPFMKDPATGAALNTVQACGMAAKMGVSLTAYGSFSFPSWGWTNPFTDHTCLYMSWNAACVEVEIDVLTGGHVVLQADILQDVGKSLNPAIDIGQVEGGFVQGSSWITLEDLEACYDKEGILNLTAESLEFAGLKNSPVSFNVSLFKGDNSENPNAPYGSKGIGEPPYSLGICTGLALRHALSFARRDNGLSPWATAVPYPLTQARLRNLTGALTSEGK